MYNDLFSIGPITVHSYGLFTAIALLMALLVACKRSKKFGLSDDICYGILFVGVITGYIGSKFTYVCVQWKEFIANPLMFLSDSGFVVVGGLTGGILGAFVYCKIKKVSFIDYFDLCVPSIAIAQGFGRIGCFMAGCCYGKETTSPIGVVFHNSNSAPNGVKLIPTQLISSGLDFIHFFILLFIAKKSKKKGLVAASYVIFYSIGRFFVEYLRDDERGNVGIFSTSQFLSIITLAVGIVILLIALKKGGTKEAIEAVEAANENEEA